MKRLLIPLITALALPQGPLLSHGYSENCSVECEDYYCPQEHQLDKKEKVKNKIPFNQK